MKNQITLEATQQPFEKDCASRKNTTGPISQQFWQASTVLRNRHSTVMLGPLEFIFEKSRSII